MNFVTRQSERGSGELLVGYRGASQTYDQVMAKANRRRVAPKWHGKVEAPIVRRVKYETGNCDSAGRRA